MIFALIICLLAPATSGETVNGVDVEKACAQYSNMARAYCRPTEDEPPLVKPKCDLYRKYCSDTVAGFTPAPITCKQIAYCKQFSGQNTLICKNEAYANASVDRQRFCANYKAYCTEVPEDPDNQCGASNSAATPVRGAPNAFNAPLPSPALYRLTDLNGGGPMASVGQSSIDNFKENAFSSAANAPLFKILGGLAGNAAKAAGNAPGQAAGGDVSSVGSGLLDGLNAGGAPTSPYGPGLGIASLPGFDAASQHGPFGTSPLWVGNNVGVGPFASGGRSTSVNPFGKVGWGNQWGAMGFSGYSGGGVDFGSVPGLTDLNNPLVGGKRRRRRDALTSLRLMNFYRYLYSRSM